MKLNTTARLKEIKVPVLAITGLQFHDLVATFTQPDAALDLDAEARDRFHGADEIESAIKSVE